VHDLLICERFADRRGAGLWNEPSPIRRWFETSFGWFLGAGEFWRRVPLARFWEFATNSARIALKIARNGQAKALEISRSLKN